MQDSSGQEIYLVSSIYLFIQLLIHYNPEEDSEISILCFGFHRIFRLRKSDVISIPCLIGSTPPRPAAYPQSQAWETRPRSNVSSFRHVSVFPRCFSTRMLLSAFHSRVHVGPRGRSSCDGRQTLFLLSTMAFVTLSNILCLFIFLTRPRVLVTRLCLSPSVSSSPPGAGRFLKTHLHGRTRNATSLVNGLILEAPSEPFPGENDPADLP